MPEPDRDLIRWLDHELALATIRYDLADDDDGADDYYWRYREYVIDNGYAELEHQYRQAVERGAVEPLPPDVTLEQVVGYVIQLHHPERMIGLYQELGAALRAHGPGATVADLAAAGKLPKRSGPPAFSIHGYRAAQQGASA